MIKNNFIHVIEHTLLLFNIIMSVFNSLKPIKITKLQVSLVPGIQETPYPTKSPTTYGKDYLGKFNQYLLGSISAKDIIHIKNVLLTKKPSLKKLNLS